MASATLGPGVGCCCCLLRGAISGALLDRWRIRRGSGGEEEADADGCRRRRRRGNCRTCPKAKKQIVLDGPVSCGKSIALAMLVHWARSEGWLVFYVPKAREWTHGGFFYRNPYSDLWDTPVQAAKILQAGALVRWVHGGTAIMVGFGFGEE